MVPRHGLVKSRRWWGMRKCDLAEIHAISIRFPDCKIPLIFLDLKCMKSLGISHGTFVQGEESGGATPLQSVMMRRRPNPVSTNAMNRYKPRMCGLYHMLMWNNRASLRSLKLHWRRLEDQNDSQGWGRRVVLYRCWFVGIVCEYCPFESFRTTKRHQCRLPLCQLHIWSFSRILEWKAYSKHGVVSVAGLAVTGDVLVGWLLPLPVLSACSQHRTRAK